MATNLFKEKCYSSKDMNLPYTSLISGEEFKIVNGQPADMWAGNNANAQGGYTVRLSYQICRAMLEYLKGDRVSVGKMVTDGNFHIEVAGGSFYTVMRMDDAAKTVRYMVTDLNRNLVSEQTASEMLFPTSKTYCYWATLIPRIIMSGLATSQRIAGMKTKLALQNSVDDRDVFWLNDEIYHHGKTSLPSDYTQQESFVYDASLYGTAIGEIKDETMLHSAAMSGRFDFATINGVIPNSSFFQATPTLQPSASPVQDSGQAAPAMQPILVTDFTQLRIVDEAELNDEEKMLVPTNDLSIMKIPQKIINVCAAIKRRIDSSEQMRNVILYGESGAGKSTATEIMAQILGLPFRSVNLDLNSEASDVLGEFIPDGTGGWSYCSPAFLQTYENGGVIELVEMNYARPGALGVLNSAMDKKNILQLKSGKIIKRHRNCVIVATINVDYEGCQKLNKALKNRHQRKVYVERLSDSDLVDLMAIFTGDQTQRKLYEKMVNAMHGMEAIIQDNNIDGIITTRDLQEWAEETLATGDPIGAAEDTILSGITFYLDEQKELKDSVLYNLFTS